MGGAAPMLLCALPGWCGPRVLGRPEFSTMDKPGAAPRRPALTIQLVRLMHACLAHRPPHRRSTVSKALGRKRPLTISRCVPSSEPLVPSSDSRNCYRTRGRWVGEDDESVARSSR